MLKHDGSTIGMKSDPVNVMDPSMCFELLPTHHAPPALGCPGAHVCPWAGCNWEDMHPGCCVCVTLCLQEEYITVHSCQVATF